MLIAGNCMWIYLIEMQQVPACTFLRVSNSNGKDLYTLIDKCNIITEEYFIWMAKYCS